MHLGTCVCVCVCVCVSVSGEGARVIRFGLPIFIPWQTQWPHPCHPLTLLPYTVHCTCQLTIQYPGLCQSRQDCKKKTPQMEPGKSKNPCPNWCWRLVIIRLTIPSLLRNDCITVVHGGDREREGERGRGREKGEGQGGRDREKDRGSGRDREGGKDKERDRKDREHARAAIGNQRMIFLPQGRE